MTEELKAKLATMPLKPGCYLMKDAQGRIIYVGKAKKLKNRVNQYFVGAHDYKTTKMAQSVRDLDYVVTNSEKEALLLEINLIKEHRPRFNIMFMDDASYPYLRLTKEEYPTLRVVRDLKKHADARYFGPYPDVAAARKTYDLLQELYPLRKCRKLPKKACLYYHLGQCLGPCEFPVAPGTYEKMYEDLTAFLSGQTKGAEALLAAKRDQAAGQLRYEEAARCQKLLESLDYVTDRQEIDRDDRRNVDAFAFYYDRNYIALQGLFVRQGQMLDRTFQLRILYEEPEEALESFVFQYYQDHPVPDLILLPAEMDVTALSESFAGKIRQPERGSYRKILELAKANARQKLEQQFTASTEHLLKEERALNELRELIEGHDDEVIEMFDNSHISGTNAAAGLVVYRGGIADKSSYRRYRVHEGADDLANMREVVYRRYYRLLMEKKALPDILMVDGGCNQIQAARGVLDQLNIQTVLVLGAVKDDRHRTSALLGPAGEPLPIRPDGDLFFLITRMQDEVHRFAIDYHRRLRSKELVHSELDDIPGVGAARKEALIRGLGSFAAIRDASEEELARHVDGKTARAVRKYFHPGDAGV